ncbi:LOB domain-containing protein 38-like [Gastrolobium bilobum]|uniref:LOB domain-containing protein 38-like n=1 Tax=Gastrolobium bilobum TaxID=150636 RepID=UPI002AB20442|nr:LOB domain-containing protein 38-like [Gastrolobium bilobum]
MSCNGCRVLRKGCSEECLLRECLKWTENPEAQGHATLFVAKFFGRATLMSFLSSVPPNQTSALFRSLMYEAVGRTLNPVNGAVGLLWSGNWHLCQLGVEKVLRGCVLSPLFDDSAAHPAHHRSTMLDAELAPDRLVVDTRHRTPSEESETTTLESTTACEKKLLQLFF